MSRKAAGMHRRAAVLLHPMTGGLIALAVALLVATALGFALRRRSGRFRTVAVAGAAASATDVSAPAPTRADLALSADDLGTELGERATLVQFSTAFCAPCRPTRQILAQVAGMVPGVKHVDIDATSRLDLVRRLRISSSPTVLVLGPEGSITKRATGLPRKADVIAALSQAIDLGTPESSPRLIVNAGNVAGPGSDSPSDSE